MEYFNYISDAINSGPTFDLHFGNFYISPSYLSAGLIIFLIFLLILTLAQVRRHFMDWSVKGASFGIFLGFLLALILEGFLLISGKTFLIAAFGWKNAPKPFSTALDLGRGKLQNVLGISSVNINTEKGASLVSDVINVYSSLSESDKEELNRLICK